VRTIVATPPLKAGERDADGLYSECQAKAERLRAALGGGISIKLGFVLEFAPELPEMLDASGNRLTLGGGRHLFISLPRTQVPAEAEDIWTALSARGLSVVIAQPECSPALRRQSDRLKRWVSGGITLQLDASSIVGEYGREIRRFSMNCLSEFHGQCVVASNARLNGSGETYLARAYKEVAERLGQGAALTCLSVTPAKLLNEHDASGVRDGAQKLSNLLRQVSATRVLGRP
jgi:tyrosine-protein phosphatase YwqE